MVSDETVCPKASVSILATFSEGFFLKNLAVRQDNSLLVSDLTRKGLWYLPPARGNAVVEPSLLASFDQPTFALSSSNRTSFW